ncbi:VanW family protein [Clostridium sp.]|uniref:VanW family protein n=1 Tax=Clostridium sp. TaxID=1506 RepID=UPI002FCC66BE
MKKRGLLILIFAISLIIIYFLTLMYIRVKKYDSSIYPEVYINNISVSGLDGENAKNKLYKELWEKVINKEVLILVGDFEYKINYRILEVEPNIQSVVDEAMNYGKQINFIKSYKLIRNPKIKNFEMKVSFNDKALDNILATIEEKINIKPMDAKIEHFGGGIFKITPEVSGRKLDSEKLKEDIKNQLNKITYNDVVILGKVHEEIPKVREIELKSINSKVSAFSTSFYNSSQSRGNNIKVATKAINGTLLMPGDIFSFNEIVGKTTAEKGYSSAKVIVGDEFVDDIGGGVCQVSTTLYNAVLRSELKILERRNHSLPISYIPLGQDAMIFYGYSDLKFMNDTDFPIFIDGHVQNSILSFNIYSDKDLGGKSYSIESEIKQTIKPKIIIKYDSQLTKGEIIVEKEGEVGYVVELYRTVIIENEAMKKELVSTSKYNGKNRVIRMGN